MFVALSERVGTGGKSRMRNVVDDPKLGRFQWDKELRFWRGSLALPSGRVAHLDISPATDDHADQPDLPEVFAAAYPVAAWLRESEAEVYAAVSRAMLELYNGTWSEEPPITAEEFASRIELVAVSVPSTGEHVNLWFTDGEMEMFGGHAIDTYFGADRQLRSAHLAG
jgi:hypothetical protein